MRYSDQSYRIIAMRLSTLCQLYKDNYRICVRQFTIFSERT